MKYQSSENRMGHPAGFRTGIILLLLTVLLLPACSTVPGKVEFDRASNPEIQRLTLRQWQNPERLDYRESGPSGTVDGYLGNMSQQGLVLKRKEQLNRVVEGIAPDFSSILTRRLAGELSVAGFITSLHQAASEGNRNNLTTAFPKDGSDACLDLKVSFFGYGYDGERYYEPLIIVYSRLTRNEGRELLFARGYVYGQRVGIADYRYIPVPEGKSYAFEEFIELTSFPDKVTEALETGLTLIAREIGRDLGK